MTTYDDLKTRAQTRAELNAELRELLVSGLDLPITSDLIDDDQPLFGRGLELDSLDTLEVISLMEETFEIIASDDDRLAFGSVNQLADYITKARAAEELRKADG